MIFTFDSIRSNKAVKKTDLQSDLQQGCTDINIIMNVCVFSDVFWTTTFVLSIERGIVYVFFYTCSLKFCYRDNLTTAIPEV